MLLSYVYYANKHLQCVCMYVRVKVFENFFISTILHLLAL